MSETKKSTKLDTTGMYNCTVVATGEDKIYHASTAQTLLDKKVIKIGSKIKKYIPKGAK